MGEGMGEGMRSQTGVNCVQSDRDQFLQLRGAGYCIIDNLVCCTVPAVHCMIGNLMHGIVYIILYTGISVCMNSENKFV